MNTGSSIRYCFDLELHLLLASFAGRDHVGGELVVRGDGGSIEIL